MRRQIGSGKPTKLFISGLHGKEHITTDPVLKEFENRVPEIDVNGKIILKSLGKEDREYVSTLDERYWDTETGKKLLSIIKKYNPSIYLELHSFTNSSSLTDPKRIDRKGVPPLVELEPEILAGSISPFLRINHFQKEDFCFLLEIPKKRGFSEELFKILEIISKGKNRDEIIYNLEIKYPKKMGKMKKYYQLFYKGELSEISPG